jgi:hypothetical protein
LLAHTPITEERSIMGLPEMWKMVHLLHMHGRPGLRGAELAAAGIDCHNDTLEPMLQGGAVARRGDDYFLEPAAAKLLEVCTIARKRDGGVDIRVGDATAFVVMPFSEQWSKRVYRLMLRPGVEDAKLKCRKGDEIVRLDGLTANIWNAIAQAGVVIADVSVPNVNVFYEIGLAHALGKDTLIFKQKGKPMPADFGGTHFYEYDLDDLTKGRALVKKAVAAWARDQHVVGVAALSKRGKK